MISKLESEHRGKLEQIDKMRQEQKYGLFHWLIESYQINRLYDLNA